MNEKQIELKRQRNLRKQLKSRAKQDKYIQYHKFEKEVIKLVKKYTNKLHSINIYNVSYFLNNYFKKNKDVTIKINYLIKRLKTLNKLEKDILFLSLLERNLLDYNIKEFCKIKEYILNKVFYYKVEFRRIKYKNLLKYDECSFFGYDNDFNGQAVREYIQHKWDTRKEQRALKNIINPVDNKKRNRL